jgi:hypothetical protein
MWNGLMMLLKLYTRNYIMNKFVGNCADIIDWSDIIAHLEDQEEGILIDCNEDTWAKRISKMNPEFAEHNTTNFNRWLANKYNLKNADFWMYRPRLHFSEDIARKFCTFAGIEFDNVWIARIDPGCTVPRHYDIFGRSKEEEKDYLRIICFINPPEPGQIFVVGDEGYHNVSQGATYLWDRATQWHSGSNSSLSPSYTLHAAGRRL